MEFDSVIKEIQEYVAQADKQLLLDHVDKESQKISFQIPDKDIKFFLQATDDSTQEKWHLWSNEDETLLQLQAIIEDITSKKLQSAPDILTKCVEIFAKGDVDEEEEEEEDEEFDDNDYYNQAEEFGDETEAKEKDDDSDVDLAEEESFFGPMNAVTGAAIKRLQKDLKNIIKVGPTLGIIATPRGNNLFYWDVKLTDVPTDSRLGKDLKEYSTKYNQEAVLCLEMQFPQDYPFAPPFIRVVKPRFKFLTGHVTIGGSICMEMLTKSGWVPSNDIESILVQVKAEIMSDPNAGLDMSRPNVAYTEQEARDAFNRMVQRYGWNK